MITYGGKNYALKYNMKRIEMIEGVTNMPTLADLQRGILESICRIWDQRGWGGCFPESQEGDGNSGEPD